MSKEGFVGERLIYLLSNPEYFGWHSVVEELIVLIRDTFPDHLKQKIAIEIFEKPKNVGDTPRLKFIVFWDEYPKKRGKGAAEKAWKKIDPAVVPDLMKALEKHKMSADWTKDGGKYIPYPATWLNQRRWEDEIEEPVTDLPDFLTEE